jgi:rhodanese-related sulfurtransferase
MTTKNITLTIVGVLVVVAGIWILRSGGTDDKVSAQANTSLVPAAAFKDKLLATPNAIVVDVRTPSEYASGHIPQAINIDVQDPNFTIAIQKLDKNLPYFVYCHSGNRSAVAVTAMKQAGITHITELQGGISAAPELLTLAVPTSTTTTTAKSISIDVGASTTENVALVTTSGTLSSDETAGLVYMREEEKLAHDVYLTLGAKWNVPIFTNISSSEQTHTDAVKALLVHYGITDPVTDMTIGVFTNPSLQKLYSDLVTTGEKSLNSALTVGVTIEDLDIHDLETRIAQTNTADIKSVYENLMKGSRNHMRSFYGQLTSRGDSYQAQYITATEFAEIVGSAKETGGNESGMGRGNGGR